MLKAIAPGTGGGGGTSVTSAAVLTANALVIGDDGVRGIKSTATGTGVLTALGINVGSAGAFVTFNGAGGTPSSLVGTNITGTAAGLTAGTVTTNANLTGVITSVGNATSIASQTGTGTKFVVDTSPTLVTPVLGVAAGTSLALGGATIGSDALGVTGTTTHNGNLSIISASLITSGNISAAAWTTNGLRNKMAAASYTDTSSSGTVAAAYTDLFGASTVLASSATTYTNYYGSYFVAPVASTNVTMTNKSALGADSISIGGQAQSTFALAVNGTSNFSNTITTSGSIVVGNTSTLNFNGRGNITSPVANSIQIGGSDVDTGPAAQTLRSQGTLAGGTSNVAGANWTLIASPGKGTGAGGSLIFQTSPAGSTGTSLNAPVTALTINSAGLVALPVIASDAALTDTTVCQDTTNHGLRSGSGALGVCLGTSGRQFKTEFEPMTAGLNEVMKIKLWNYRYKPGHGDNGVRMQYGPTAQDIESVLPDLAGHGANGETINYDWGALIPISLRAIQQLKAETDKLLTISIRALQEQQEQIDDLVKRLAA